MGEHRSTIIIAASIILIVGLVVGWTFISSGQQERSLPLTEVTDKDVIQRSAELSHLNIATSENFARQKIYVVSAYLKNLSEKPLRSAEVKMTFTDFDGKPIREYSQKILNPNQKPIPPGTELQFEVRQENLPRGWNYRVPVTEITKLGY
jgi:Protein of unknown function (DUF3426)